MGDFLEGLITVVAVLLIAVCIIGPMVLLGNALDKESCRRKAVQMGVEWNHGILKGCMIYKEEWIPLDNYRLIEERGKE